MKIGRTEKIWLASVLFFWVFYNFPGFPPYGSETACIIHGLPLPKRKKNRTNKG